MLTVVLLVLASVASAAVGALGGIGGATLLVPGLVLAGVDPAAAAPLGLLSVAAGSLAAAALQLDEGVVHHRLGVTLETVASAGAILGALVSGALSATALSWVLGASAIVAAAAGARRTGIRNVPVGEFAAESPGEWPGTLAGAYEGPGGLIPYQARRLPLGLGAMLGAGMVSGLAGVGGGFIKTPAMSEIMGVPVKVAAATTTFTLGITASAGLLVFLGQGRLEPLDGAAVVVGGMVGGAIGAKWQQRLDPAPIRRVLSVLLACVGVIIVVTA